MNDDVRALAIRGGIIILVCIIMLAATILGVGA
jgi:hypothetical protein